MPHEVHDNRGKASNTDVPGAWVQNAVLEPTADYSSWHSRLDVPPAMDDVLHLQAYLMSIHQA